MKQEVVTNLNLTTPSDNILELRDLKVYFELKKFGFQHAGYVHAVDGVDLSKSVVKPSQSSGKAVAVRRA